MLGLATGSSPIRVYKELVSLHKQGRLSFRNVVTFNLVGMPNRLISVHACCALLCSQLNRYWWTEAGTALQDEYCGLQADDLQSYHNFMHVHLFDHISDIKPANIHIPDGTLARAADISR